MLAAGLERSKINVEDIEKEKDAIHRLRNGLHWAWDLGCKM
jgi:hypothetical protein